MYTRNTHTNCTNTHRSRRCAGVERDSMLEFWDVCAGKIDMAVGETARSAYGTAISCCWRCRVRCSMRRNGAHAPITWMCSSRVHIQSTAFPVKSIWDVVLPSNA